MNNKEKPKPDSEGKSPGKTAADLVKRLLPGGEKLAVVGSAYIEGNPTTRRIFVGIGAAIILLLVYPVISLFAAIAIVRAMPLVGANGLQATTRQFLITSIGVDAESASAIKQNNKMIDENNRVVDTTLIETLRVGGKAGTYIATPGQEISFAVSVTRAGSSTDSACTKDNQRTTKIATMQVRFEGSAYEVSRAIELGLPGVITQLVPGVGSGDWEQISKNNKRSFYPVTIEMTPVGLLGQCGDYDVLLLTTMYKLKLAASAQMESNG